MRLPPTLVRKWPVPNCQRMAYFTPNDPNHAQTRPSRANWQAPTGIPGNPGHRGAARWRIQINTTHHAPPGCSLLLSRKPPPPFQRGGTTRTRLSCRWYHEQRHGAPTPTRRDTQQLSAGGAPATQPPRRRGRGGGRRARRRRSRRARRARDGTPLSSDDDSHHPLLSFERDAIIPNRSRDISRHRSHSTTPTSSPRRARRWSRAKERSRYGVVGKKKPDASGIDPPTSSSETVAEVVASIAGLGRSVASRSHSRTRSAR